MPHDVLPPSDPLRSVQLGLANPGKSAVLVTGAPGSGKSHLLDRVIVSERERARRAGAAPTAVLFHRPSCGTEDPRLAALLRGGEPAPVGSAGAGSASRSAPGAVPPLLVVDDLDSLDGSSLSLLSLSLDRALVRLVGAVRTARAAGVFRRLRPVRPLALVALRPWTKADLRRYAATPLGGELHALTVRRLMDFSCGSPLCLTELLEHGPSTERLRVRHGLWCWQGALDVPPLTAARLGEELGGLDDGVLDLLVSVALQSEADLQLLERVHGAAVERADDLGLLDVEHASGAVRARLRPALLGSVLLQTTSATRRRRLARQLIDLLAGPDSGPRDPAALARLSRLSSLPLPPPARLPAARAAVQQHDADTALWLLDEQAGCVAEVVRLRAAVLAEGGRFAPAAQVLDDAVRSGQLADDEVDEVLTWRAGLLCLGAGDREGWERWARAGRPGTPWLASWTLVVRTWHGEPPQDGGSGAPPRAADPSLPAGADAERALIADVARQAQAGAVRAAVADAQRARSAGLPGGPTPRLHLTVLLGVCQLLSGAVEEAEQLVAEIEALARDWPYAYGLAALLAGLCAMSRGFPERAVVRLGEALTCLEDTAAVVLHRFGLAQLALAQVMCGRRPEGELALLDTDGPAPRLPRALQELTELCQAEVLLALGAREAAAVRARAVADCRQSATALVELLALHLVARARPGPDVTARLRRLAAQVDVPTAVSFAEHAHAAEKGDAAGLADLALQYDAAGMHWLAGETAARAIGTGAAQGGAWVARSRQVLHRLEAHPHVQLPASWFEHGSHLVRLTEREREIAELVATGRSTPQIAAHLQLSQRTVENHLQHAYRKLGVRRRQDLSVLLSQRVVSLPEQPPRGPLRPLSTT